MITAAELVTASELAEMRAALALSYTDLADVRRLPPSERRQGRSGGTRQSWQDYDTVALVPCRLSRGFIPAREQQLGGGLAEVTTAVFYTAPPSLAPGADIRASDRVVVTSQMDAAEPPVYLEVQSAEVRRTLNLEQVVTCQRVGAPPTQPVVPLST